MGNKKHMVKCRVESVVCAFILVKSGCFTDRETLQGLFTKWEGNPGAMVYRSISGPKITLIYKRNFLGWVTLSPGSTLQAWVTFCIMRDHIRLKYTVFVNSKIWMKIHCFEETNDKHTAARNLNWYCYCKSCIARKLQISQLSASIYQTIKSVGYADFQN